MADWGMGRDIFRVPHTNMTKYISLFSGIGAFECAVKDDPSFECVGYSEVDPHALQVYRKWYPEHRSLGDVRQLTDATARALRPDLIVAGFPCTDLSSCKALVSKKEKRGLRGGGRSALFVELVRIIQACLEVNPKLDILVENVASMKRCHRLYITSVLRHVLHKRVHRNVVCASHFSVQRRKRLFWTTWPLPDSKDDLSKPTSLKAPYFKNIVDHSDDAMSRYKYVYTRGADVLNNMVKCSRGYRHSAKTKELPVVVRSKAKHGWYTTQHRVYTLHKHVEPKNRLVMDLHRSHTNQAKSKTLTTATNAAYIRHINTSDPHAYKFRYLTRAEMHRCFDFPIGYCSILVTRKRVHLVLANSIVVSVLNYITSSRSASSPSAGQP